MRRSEWNTSVRPRARQRHPTRGTRGRDRCTNPQHICAESPPDPPQPPPHNPSTVIKPRARRRGRVRGPCALRKKPQPPRWVKRPSRSTGAGHRRVKPPRSKRPASPLVTSSAVLTPGAAPQCVPLLAARMSDTASATAATPQRSERKAIERRAHVVNAVVVP